MKNTVYASLIVGCLLTASAAFGVPECWNLNRQYVVIDNGINKDCYRPKVTNPQSMDDFESVQAGLCSSGRFRMSRLDTKDIACLNVSRCGDAYGAVTGLTLHDS
jgi:hypothetical protein